VVLGSWSDEAYEGRVLIFQRTASRLIRRSRISSRALIHKGLPLEILLDEPSFPVRPVSTRSMQSVQHDRGSQKAERLFEGSRHITSCKLSRGCNWPQRFLEHALLRRELRFAYEQHSLAATLAHARNQGCGGKQYLAVIIQKLQMLQLQ